MNHKAMYIHGNRQLKSRVSQGVWSPKNTKNTPQIITEGREKKQELRSHRAHWRCWHMAGIKNGVNTEKDTVKTHTTKQTKPQGGRDREARKRKGNRALTDSPE